MNKKAALTAAFAAWQAYSHSKVNKFPMSLISLSVQAALPRDTIENTIA